MADQTFGEQAFGEHGEGNWPPAERRRRGGFSCFSGCLMGCGIAFVLVIAVIAVGGFVVWRLAQNAVSEDPIVVGQWLQATVPCEVPPGYVARHGAHFDFQVIPFKMTFVLIEPEQRAAEGGPGPNRTTFVVFGMPGVDQNMLRVRLQEEQQKHGQAVPRAGEEKEQEVDVKVGNRTVKATRGENSENGHKTINYFVPIRNGVLLFAAGPAEQFDQAAFEKLLASMKTDEKEE